MLISLPASVDLRNVRCLRQLSFVEVIGNDGRAQISPSAPRNLRLNVRQVLTIGSGAPNDSYVPQADTERAIKPYHHLLRQRYALL